MGRVTGFVFLAALTFHGRAKAQAPEEPPQAPSPIVEPEVAGDETTDPLSPQDEADPTPEPPFDTAAALEEPEEPAPNLHDEPPHSASGSELMQETRNPAPPPTYDDQEWTYEDEEPETRFGWELSGYFQARAERSSTEDRSDPEYNDPQAETSYAAAFSIPRAVVRLAGHAHTPALTYRVQMNLGGLRFDLEDAYMNYRFAQHLEIRAGKHKRPFARQFLTPLSSLQFASPSYIQDHFGATRDVGVLVHNDHLEGDGFEYALGVYQGRNESVQYYRTYDGTAAHFEGERTNSVPSSMEPTVAFRLGYGSGPGTYSEGALEGGDVLFGAGMSGLVDVNANQTNDSRAQLEIDFIFKVGGLSCSSGIFAEMRQTGSRFVNDRDQGAAGIYLQGGYLIGRVFEPTLRLETIESGEGPQASSRYDRSASTIGFNLYFKRHAFKWTNEFTLGVEGEGRGQPEDLRERLTLALSQLQVAF